MGEGQAGAEPCRSADSETDADALGAWCAMWLGARPIQIMFSVGHLSRVTGLLLADGRRVAVKVRPSTDRLQSCAYVQQHLWYAGFPCPEPLVGPVPYGFHAEGDGRAGIAAERGAQRVRGRAGDVASGGLVANAEMIVDGGETLSPGAAGAVDAYAGLLARLIRLAPSATDVHFLADAPPWTAWDHGGPGVWPPADDRPDDLNACAETAWLDDLGRAIRVRLGAMSGAPLVVGHGDWEAQNLRWHGLEPVAVHDWDSVIAAPEPVVVGLAAAVWPAGSGGTEGGGGDDGDEGMGRGAGEGGGGASVAQTAAFIASYQRESERVWSSTEVEVAWAAGLWVRAFNAKKAGPDGTVTLTPAEAAERSRRAGMRPAPTGS